ncbi:hypothetical protein AVEN_31531-1 [Araneus ventricosus]|uniref:Uncharacterized protein n=1 Tax=Araneus ventricosus TaxID=182803 RepID=A0A4Y2BW17_ARAVE|nr:hypothetical protein AVEN_31531-1 [Araneus ventricosus]
MSFLQKPATLTATLVLMVDNGLSTRQYLRIREQAENLNCKLYPLYHKVKEANPDSNFSLQQACHKFVMTRVQVCHKFVMTSVQACSKLTKAPKSP